MAVFPALSLKVYSTEVSPTPKTFPGGTTSREGVLPELSIAVIIGNVTVAIVSPGRMVPGMTCSGHPIMLGSASSTVKAINH